jgi:hypothetical protein
MPEDPGLSSICPRSFHPFGRRSVAELRSPHADPGWPQPRTSALADVTHYGGIGRAPLRGAVDDSSGPDLTTPLPDRGTPAQQNVSSKLAPLYRRLADERGTWPRRGYLLAPCHAADRAGTWNRSSAARSRWMAFHGRAVLKAEFTGKHRSRPGATTAMERGGRSELFAVAMGFLERHFGAAPGSDAPPGGPHRSGLAATIVATVSGALILVAESAVAGEVRGGVS